MASTNFGYVPKCCQLLVGNSQKMKNELFFFKAVSAVSIREVSKNLEMNTALLWLMAVKENIFKMGREIRMHQSEVIYLAAFIPLSIQKKVFSFSQLFLFLLTRAWVDFTIKSFNMVTFHFQKKNDFFNNI